MKFLCAFGLLSASLFISGCGDANIDRVKSLNFPADNTHTNETALTKRPACDDTSWKSKKDDQGRLVVEYRCQLKDILKAMESARDSKIRNSEELFRSMLSNERNNLTLQEGHLARATEYLEEAKTRNARMAAEVQKRVDGEPSEQIKRMIAERFDSDHKVIIERAEDDLSLAQSGRLLAVAKKRLADVEVERLKALNTIHQQFDGIKSVTEVHQWVLKKDQVIPIFFGFEVDTDLGKKIRNFSSPLYHSFWQGKIARMRDSEYSMKSAADFIDGIGPTTEKQIAAAPSGQTGITARTQGAENSGPPKSRGETCYDEKLKAFRTEVGEDTPVRLDMINEWRGECGLKPVE